MFMVLTLTKGEKFVINVRQILYIEAQKEKTVIRLIDEKTYDVREKIDVIMEKMVSMPGIRVVF